jgi:O-acetylhomoserine (thiol)-lyase
VGQWPSTAVAATLCRAGDEFVTASALYGGTHTLFTSTLRDLGLNAVFVDEEADLPRAFSDRTRFVYCETIGNPKLTVPDLAYWAQVAHDHGVPLVVDNTFATPYLCRPLDFGADLVIHSLTKWMAGHGHALGGIVVDAGRFDYRDPRYAQFSAPDESYHGLVFADLGPNAMLTRLRVKHLRDTGAALSPFNAFLILNGIETLGLRMERESANALELARRLSQHPRVAWVQYPGLPGSPAHALARRYFSRDAFGGILNFGVVGGLEAGRALVDRVTLWSHVANVGDVRSLIIHPASTTHSQLSPEAQQAAGVSPDLIRLSCGIEHVDDLWDALSAALDGLP